MGEYVISSCSTADLTAEHFEKKNIAYVCFHYELDGVSYQDDLGKTMPFDVFYQKMVDGAETKTYQVNADEYEAHFKKYLEQGKDIIHVCLSSGISGTVNCKIKVGRRISGQKNICCGLSCSFLRVRTFN